MYGFERGGRAVRLALVAALLSLAACAAGDDPVAAAAAGGSVAGDAPAAQSRPGVPPSAPAPGTAAASATGADVAIGSRELAHPEDLQMVLLGYRLEGRQPPIAEWAAAQYSVTRANEFERDAVLEGERARLQAVYDGTEGVGLLRMDVRARFGEYDGARGGYYIDGYTAGSVFRFTAHPAPHRGAEETITVRIDNPGELNFWALDPAAAQDVLARNGGRDVNLDSRLRITGISRRSDGPVLSATLLGYRIVSTRYRQPAVLGEFAFDDHRGE